MTTLKLDNLVCNEISFGDSIEGCYLSMAKITKISNGAFSRSNINTNRSIVLRLNFPAATSIGSQAFN